jgi:hypothetical protein
MTSIKVLRERIFLSFTALNILSLRICITCNRFLYLYVLHESYDRRHLNAEIVCRVVSHVQEPDNEYWRTSVQIPLAEKHPEVKNDVPASLPATANRRKKCLMKRVFILPSPLFEGR